MKLFAFIILFSQVRLLLPKTPRWSMWPSALKAGDQWLMMMIFHQWLVCFRGDPDSDLDLATSYPNSKFIAILPSDLIQAVQVEPYSKQQYWLIGGVRVWKQQRRFKFNPSIHDGFLIRTSSTQSLESCSTTVRRRWRISLVGQNSNKQTVNQSMD